MLIKVSVENFKSFGTHTELNMITSSKIRMHEAHRTEIGNIHLLKHAVVYGANASGKTNLIDVFLFMKATMQNGIPAIAVKDFCRTKKENKDRESFFELQFSIGDSFYAYGFTAILSQRIIKSEWLYELFQNGSARRVFDREGQTKPQIDINLSIQEQQRFNTYAEDFETNDTGLFLTEMNRNKKIDKASNFFVFTKVYAWLMNNLVVYTPNNKHADFRFYYNNESLSKINQLISTFDTGITDIHIQPISIDELRKDIPEFILQDIMKNMSEAVTQTGNRPVRTSMRSENNFFSIEMDERFEIHVTTLRIRHGNSYYDFSFNEESDGSRRLFDLIDMLLTTDEDTVFIVDELERSLHPMLTKHFLELFATLHEQQRIQLIFTTHESVIMDQDCFRRDEFWLVERNAENESIIYPLDRFKERHDKDINKAYLEGRYGAIPVFAEYVAPEVK